MDSASSTFGFSSSLGFGFSPLNDSSIAICASMNPAKSGLVDDPGRFPGRGAVAASTDKGNGWPLGAALASDLGVGGEARPVMEGELLNLSRKLFIPAGTSNGLGAVFPTSRELAQRLYVVLAGEWFHLRVALLFSRLSPFGERFQQPTTRPGANYSAAP